MSFDFSLSASRPYCGRIFEGVFNATIGVLRRAALGLALPLLLVGVSAQAQDEARYPSKPVKLVVPFAPGGAVDLLARILGQELAKGWGQPVVVDNRGGANGIIAAEAVAHSAPDGYTLLLGTNGTHAANEALYRELPYKPKEDFAPIVLLASIPHIIVVHPSVPAKNLSELIALAKKDPGGLRYGSAGNGSSLHLSGELFKQATGTDMVHIPYKGGGLALTDLLGGNTQVMFAVAPLVLPQIKAGKLRPLAVMSSKRSPLAPDVPTTAEQGVPGVESTAWIGLLAPKATSPAVIEKLNKAVNAALIDESFQVQLRQRGFDVEGGSAAEFASFLSEETSKWKKVVVKSGAKPD